MPAGPQGQNRLADVVGTVHVAKIATGVIEESPQAPKEPAWAGGRKVRGHDPSRHAHGGEAQRDRPRGRLRPLGQPQERLTPVSAWATEA